MVIGTDSLRQQIYELWVKNPYTTAKTVCLTLKLDYKTQGHMVNVRLSEFRSYHNFGSPQKAQALPHRRVFVWESIPRPGELPLEWWRVGWRVSKNRNEMWVFGEDARGSVHWYKEGLVRLYVRGAVQLAKVKEVFCRAFCWFGPEDLKKYLDVPLREEMKHWVFDVGAPMPRFDIRQFERSHGIRIFTDGSHPTSLEVEETTPFWIDSLELVTTQFGHEIQEHLKLIKMWQEEAKFYRGKFEDRQRDGLLRRLFRWLW